MNSTVLCWLSVIASLGLFAGCGQKPVTKSAGGHDDHGEESSGASYVEGKGILLMEATKKSLGIELMVIEPRELSSSTKLTAQVYRGAAEPSRRQGGERTGFAYATAQVAPELAEKFATGQRLTFVPGEKSDQPHTGLVWRFSKAQLNVLKKVEILLELTDPDNSLPVGSFVETDVPARQTGIKVINIPRQSVLTTSTGTYVFVQNGEHLLRTEVKTGVSNPDQIEITEGLYEGDVIALKPVESLYMIELRATKGGGHSH